MHGTEVSRSTRIGVGMTVIGVALLIGNPITGALLRPPKYTWWAAILFSGVRTEFCVSLMQH